jgi:glycosyltransferase involved in cell wall biosynthesis
LVPPGPTTSLIIATYNWKEALAAVLSTVRIQRELPSEVLIADDGSRADTGELIAHEAATFPVPLRHIRHDDTGFRLGTIRNEAMARATGDYLIQLDGDMLLHPAFVESHKRFAERGWYAQGGRVMLEQWVTERVLADPSIRVGLFTPGVRNRINSIHAPMLTRVVRGSQDPLLRTRGCNMAFWRDDILLVNGFNEAMEGWGREDSELAARLMNAGIRRRNLKFAAVAWHLCHPTRPRDAFERNHMDFERAIRENLRWAERGIDAHHP